MTLLKEPYVVSEFDPREKTKHTITTSPDASYDIHLTNNYVIRYYDPVFIVARDGIVQYAMTRYTILQYEHGVLWGVLYVDREALNSASVVKEEHNVPDDNMFDVVIEYDPERRYVEIKPQYWQEQPIDIDSIHALAQRVADSLRRRGEPYTTYNFMFTLSDYPTTIKHDHRGGGQYLVVVDRTRSIIVAAFALFPNPFSEKGIVRYAIHAPPELGFRYNLDTVQNINPVILYRPPSEVDIGSLMNRMISAMKDYLEEAGLDMLHGASHNRATTR